MSNVAKHITQFDSATSMLYALASALKGKSFRGAGIIPPGLGFVPGIFNYFSFDFRQQVYQWSGWHLALKPEKLKMVQEEEISRWVVAQYPRRRGEFLGVREDKYPLDFQSFSRYHNDLKRKIPDRFDSSRRLTLEELGHFIAELKEKHDVEWQ